MENSKNKTDEPNNKPDARPCNLGYASAEEAKNRDKIEYIVKDGDYNKDKQFGYLHGNQGSSI